MWRQRYYYLIHLQFLGFRFNGWQKQPGLKTVEGMLSKTLDYILPDTRYKILGAGRTDAKVSALDMAFELFLEEKPLVDLQAFKTEFNKNLPSDIRITHIREVDKGFNIIQDSRSKEYVYLFSFGEKNHPYCAPFLANIQDNLDIELMKTGAALFVGTHDFSSFAARLKPNARVLRTVDACEIKPNTVIQASFFPRTSYALHIVGAGFMRYQIRLIMGALIQLGKGDLTLLDLETELKTPGALPVSYVAPGSGLMLYNLEFE